MNRFFYFIPLFLTLFFSCKNEKNIDSKKVNVIENDSVQNVKIETILPQEVDSLNIFFTRNRFDYYMLHINKSDYLLLDLDNKKTYNVNIMKDSLDKFLTDLFIDEKKTIEIERIKFQDGTIKYADFNSMSVSLYYKFFEIDFGNETTEVTFSNDFNKFYDQLYFITTSPENLEKRLSKIEQFRESIKNKKTTD